jgi:hypothetical protein
MTDDKIYEVLERYSRDIAPATPARGPVDTDWRLWSFAMRYNHLAWIITQIREFLTTGRREKAMRWFGFLQGAMATGRPQVNLYTIEQLAEHNRPDKTTPPLTGAVVGIVPAPFGLVSAITIDLTLAYLQHAREQIGGDKCLILSLAASELEDVDVSQLLIVDDDSGQYVQVSAVHPALTYGQRLRWTTQNGHDRLHYGTLWLNNSPASTACCTLAQIDDNGSPNIHRWFFLEGCPEEYRGRHFDSLIEIQRAAEAYYEAQTSQPENHT